MPLLYLWFPSASKAVRIRDYRSISLISASYKIIGKVLSNKKVQLCTRWLTVTNMPSSRVGILLAASLLRMKAWKTTRKEVKRSGCEIGLGESLRHNRLGFHRLFYGYEGLRFYLEEMGVSLSLFRSFLCYYLWIPFSWLLGVLGMETLFLLFFSYWSQILLAKHH